MTAPVLPSPFKARPHRATTNRATAPTVPASDPLQHAAELVFQLQELPVAMKTQKKSGNNPFPDRSLRSRKWGLGLSNSVLLFIIYSTKSRGPNL